MYLDQTRSIYQRKLLEILTHEIAQGYDSDESINDEPLTIRNEYKATKSTRSTYRLVDLIFRRVNDHAVCR